MFLDLYPFGCPSGCSSMNFFSQVAREVRPSTTGGCPSKVRIYFLPLMSFERLPSSDKCLKFFICAGWGLTSFDFVQEE